ncbi:MAG: hypothetical protein IT208_03805 [Chthonomonadales bacterium]|nr:hypothetical protein [Chthonomonadales bacterium]
MSSVTLALAALACVALAGSVPAEAAPRQAVRVTDFGALPDDEADDTAGVLAALDRCAESGARRLVFPPGRYRFRAGANPRSQSVLFPVTRLDGLTIEGVGAELVCSGITGVFAFDHCRSLRVRGLSIDWDRPPFSIGRVVAAAPRHFDVEMEEGYPVEGGEPVQAFMSYDPKTRLPARRGLDVYGAVTSTELVRPGVLRVRLSRDIAVPVGVLMALRHQVYAYNAFELHRCRDVVVEDCTVYTCPGMGLAALVCEDVTLRRFRVLLRPGTNRVLSATADGSHFGGCKGTVRLEGCVFEGMGDDGANIKSGLYLTVRRIADERVVLAQHSLKMADVPDPGDRLEVSHPEDLLPYATLRVRKAELLPEDGMHRVELENPLPADLREGDVLGNASRAPKVRISDCVVRRNRARGMLLQTRDVRVERCRFEDCTSGAVYVMTEIVHFNESIGTRDVVVRDCVAENCNYGAAMGDGALMVFAWLRDFAAPPRPGVHRNVRLERNTVRGTDNCAIFVSGTQGITLKGNVIEQACRKPTGDQGRSAVAIRSSSGILLEGNRIDPGRQGAGFESAVTLAEDCVVVEPAR